MKHNTLHNAFPIVAAALGNRFGIQVKVGGHEAYTDGKMIQLPAYQGDDANYHNVAWGVLAHEAAHIRYSDFTLNYGTSVLRRRLAGAIEDVRIEVALANEFPGTQITLRSVVDYLIDQGHFRAYTQDDHPANVLYGYILKYLRVHVLGQVALQALLTQNEQHVQTRFPIGILERIKPLLKDVPHGLACEQDSLTLADRILDVIQDAIEPEPDPESKSKSDNKKPPHEGTDATEKNEGKGTHPDSEPEPRNDKADSKQTEEADTKEHSVGVHQSAIAEEAPNDLDTETSDQTSADLRDALAKTEVSDIDHDVFDTLKASLALASQASSTQLMPVGCEPPLQDEAGLNVLTRVTHESRKMRASLQGLVQSERLTHRWSTAHGTRLNTQRLARVGLGETKLFLKRELKSAPNTAIHILLDGSYSMNTPLQDSYDHTVGTRLSMTLSASLALALALEGVPGVSLGITGFPGRELNSVYRLLTPGQRVKTRASAFTFLASGSTPMTEALWFGAAALLQCREPRKVLLVLTDGQPDDVASTLDMLARCQSSGIETVGVGLGVDVGHLFPVALRIHAFTDLRTQLFTLSKALLVAK